MPVDMAALAADLAAESAVTRALVAGLDEAGWHTPTPAAGWDIADQISHLAYFDEVTVRSALHLAEFEAELAAAPEDVDPDAIAARLRDRTGAQLLLLDEITEGLAPVIVQAMGRAIRRLKERGYTIVLVEQNSRFAAPLADRHYVMEHGKIVMTVEKADLHRKTDELHDYLGV